MTQYHKKIKIKFSEVKMKHFLGFYLAALLVASVMFFGGCSEQSPTAPAPVEKVVHDTTTVVDRDTVYVPTDPVNPPSGPVLPPVASWWFTDINGVEWTYFPTWFMKGKNEKKQEDWYIDPVPDWILAHKGMNGVREYARQKGQEMGLGEPLVFKYAGEIELAAGSIWHCHRIRGHWVSFQVLSQYGEYANPGLAGNWIADKTVDPNRPTLIPGAYVAPPTYYFAPVPWGSWQ